jgi:hypothetical protein
MIEPDVFLPKILPYAPGVAEPTALAAVIVAAQRFCERTRLWRDCDTFTVTPDSCDVVCVPVDAVLFEIESARFNDSKIDPVSLDWLETREPNWRLRQGDVARWITQLTTGSVRVIPVCSGTLSLSTVLRPADEAQTLPDFLGTLYSTAIADGALAEILMTPARQFTDVNRAAFYAARFDQRINELTGINVRGQHNAPYRTKAQFF